MATLKIAQLRSTLDAFARLYDRPGASEQADALRSLSNALAKADKLTVDEVAQALEKDGVRSPFYPRVIEGH